MNPFETGPKVEVVTAAELARRRIDGPLFRLLVDYPVSLPGFPTFVIPTGYETDWASIPPAARFYQNGDDPTILVPSLVHDWLYSEHGYYQVLAQPLTRQQCDDVLRQLMRFCGASALRAQTVYLAVRLGGGSHWTAK